MATPPVVSFHSVVHFTSLFLLTSLCNQDSNIVFTEMLEIAVTQSGYINAICLWFDVSLLPPQFAEIKINNGPSCFCSESTESHYRQAVFLFEKAIYADSGTIITVKIEIDKSAGVWAWLL